MTRLAELRELLATGTGPDATVAQLAILEEASVNALPALLDVAAAAEEIFGHLASSTDLNTDYEINPPLYRLMRALEKLGVGTDGIMRSDK